jgi:integrase
VRIHAHFDGLAPDFLAILPIPELAKTAEVTYSQDMPGRAIPKRTKGKKTWEYRITLPDRTRHFQRGFADREDAYEWEREMRSRPVEPPKPKIEIMTLNEWWDIFSSKFQGHLKPYTRAGDMRDWKNHIEDTPLGKTLVHEITPEVITDWRNELVGAPNTLQGIYDLFSKTIKAAADPDVRNPPLIDSPPKSQRQYLPKGNVRKQYALTIPQVKWLANNVDQRYRGLVFLGCFGGLRIAELCSISVNEIDWKSNIIHVRTQITDLGGHLEETALKGQKTKEPKIRDIELSPYVIHELRIHIETYRPTQRLFPAPESPILRAGNFRRRFWNPAVKKAGLPPITPHDMRRTAATIWWENGVPELRAMEWLGHEESKMLRTIYVKTRPGTSNAQLSAIDELLLEAETTVAAVLPEIRRNGLPTHIYEHTSGGYDVHYRVWGAEKRQRKWVKELYDAISLLDTSEDEWQAKMMAIAR